MLGATVPPSKRARSGALTCPEEREREVKRSEAGLPPCKMPLRSAYCVLRTENIFVCWCCVGSDRAAGVGVSLGTLDLVRVEPLRIDLGLSLQRLFYGCSYVSPVRR